MYTIYYKAMKLFGGSKPSPAILCQHSMISRSDKVLTGRKSTCESRWTVAGKSIHLIIARATVLTWITSTFVDVCLTTSTCKRKPKIGKRESYIETGHVAGIHPTLSGVPVYKRIKTVPYYQQQKDSPGSVGFSDVQIAHKFAGLVTP